MYPYAETTQGHKDSLDPDAFFLQDHITGVRLARWGHANSDNGSEAGTPSPVSHLEGDREFADSPLEEAGFELVVPL